MKDIFTLKKLWKVVSGATQKPRASSPPTPVELKAQEQVDDVDKQDLTMIRMSVSDDRLSHVKDAMTSKQPWDSLKSIIEIMNESRVLYLRNELYQMRMSKGDSITNHIARIKYLKAQLNVVGELVRPKELVPITLNNLPNSYEMFVTSLTTTSRVSTITFEELCGMLLQQEQSLKKFNGEGNSMENSFAAKWKGKSTQPKFQSSQNW
eukprot:Gb_19842 [translate_table: standard]